MNCHTSRPCSVRKTASVRKACKPWPVRQRVGKRFLSRRQRLFPCCWKPRICRTPACRSSIRKSHSRKAHHTASVKGNLPYKPFPGFEGHIPTGPVKILFQPQNGLSIWSAKPSSRSRLCCCSKPRA